MIYIDDCNSVCSLIIDLKEALDIGDQQILLRTFFHYDIAGSTHNCFKSYLVGLKQFVYISEYSSDMIWIKYEWLWRSTLVTPLCLLYPSELTSVSEKALPIYFADDDHLSYASENLSNAESTINYEPKSLVEW